MTRPLARRIILIVRFWTGFWDDEKMRMRAFGYGLLAFAGLQLASAQECDVMELISGDTILIIDAALPEFRKTELDLEAYSVRLFEQPESIAVIFVPNDAELSERGGGSGPTFEVEISKVDRRVLRANFAR